MKMLGSKMMYKVQVLLMMMNICSMAMMAALAVMTVLAGLIMMMLRMCLRMRGGISVMAATVQMAMMFSMAGEGTIFS
jgi:hypothetical protein